ncbi:Regulatory protein SoxS [Andreprevotia sp. IGB-42]|uniref:helix-turn-helix domain-containing protein n=1 Tax=Andreprevotia sp. IGB-42 TaxID=2497473 RepID=UPI00135CC395|nr:helix-turn-helix domain-containing protein [Andreprevotia sp. IGB-42]KAF0813559.1 Regulatory protein SoxS [Andreprevotia sp. IGB-42]
MTQLPASSRQIRIERAVDCINHGYAQALSLDALAAAACYSSYHFVRAFEAEVGETPFDVLRKRRLYAGAYRLLTAPGTTVAALAEECGFAYASSFAKGFRQHFGMSASDWRHGGWRAWAGQLAPAAQTPLEVAAAGPAAEYMDEEVPGADEMGVLQLPAQSLAYRRFRGVWGDALISAALATLDRAGMVRRFYGVRHDLLHLRGARESCFDVCLPLAGDAAPPAGLGRMALSGGLYAVRTLAAGAPYVSWRSLLAAWPARSACLPDLRRPMIEVYEQAVPLRCHTLYLPVLFRT